MTAEQIVREKYPKAEITHEPATNQMGQSQPITEARWVIYSFGGLGGKELGSGKSPDEAWKNAAKAI